MSKSVIAAVYLALLSLSACANTVRGMKRQRELTKEIYSGSPMSAFLKGQLSWLGLFARTG